jgi:hypothetical protein
MDHRGMCVANVQYKRPGGGSSGGSGLLRYLTYRDSPNDPAHFVAGQQRWSDHGLGRSVTEITRQCEGWQSQHVGMFSLVYNVNPDLMAMVAPENREPFVRELTEQVTEAFFQARGIDTGVEWSYVLHNRETTDVESPGRDDPHTHAILPGTYYDEDSGERVPLYFSRNDSVNHIQLLHRLTEQQMEMQMEHYVGHDWELRYDAIALERERERGVTDEPAHGTFISDTGMEIAFWCGTRQTDEDTRAAGYYTITPDNDIVFRPLVRDLNHEDAALLAQLLHSEQGGDFARLRSLAGDIDHMTNQQREVLFAELRQLDFNPARQPSIEQPRPIEQTPSFDIDF